MNGSIGAEFVGNNTQMSSEANPKKKYNETEIEKNMDTKPDVRQPNEWVSERKKQTPVVCLMHSHENTKD